MKKKIIAIFLVINLVIVGIVAAQSTSSGQLDEAKTLKDKIASKVEELQKKDQRAVAGIIAAISDTDIRITNTEKIVYNIKLDKDLTKVYIISDDSLSEAQVEDLEKNDYIVVSGPIEGRSVTANSIYRDSQYFIGSGKITEVNLTDFYIKALTTDKETYTLDLETGTQRFILNVKSLEVETTTLAKIKEGDTIHFVYQKSGEEREKNRYSAKKILILPQEYFIK